MKFDALVNKILNEEMPQPYGLSSYDKGVQDARTAQPPSGGFDKEAQAVQQADRNAGGDKGSPHYMVQGNEKCQSWYQKNLPDTTMAKYGWKAFPVSRKYNAGAAASEFAKKWGLKEPRYIAS
jgi:hypothetical protein